MTHEAKAATTMFGRDGELNLNTLCESLIMEVDNNNKLQKIQKPTALL